MWRDYSLLKIIKTSSHELESHTFAWDALSQAKRRFYSYRQGEHESNTMHVKNLKNLFSIVEYYDEKMLEDQVLLKTVKDKAKLGGEAIADEECRRRAKNKCLAFECLTLPSGRVL